MVVGPEKSSKQQPIPALSSEKRNGAAEEGDGDILPPIFLMGSNSYLLSGELATNLTGRYVRIELFTLSFFEHLGLREHLGKPDQLMVTSFRDLLRYGGFPKSVEYDDESARARYIVDVVEQIIQKDIRERRKYATGWDAFGTESVHGKLSSGVNAWCYHPLCMHPESIPFACRRQTSHY